jgi:hypothetical protein
MLRSMIGLANKVLGLPLEERVSVDAELLASLEEPLEPTDKVEAAWAVEHDPG